MRLAGKDWYKAFMKRHPEISKRKAQFMNPARAQKLNKFIVDDHFERINEIYNQLDLKDHPERIYNMDEKGCRLTIHHQQAVLAKKGAKRVHLVSSEHAESVTIAGCVNALVSDAVEEEILGCSSPAEVPLTPTRSSPISSSPEMLLALTNNSPTMLNRSPSEALTPVRPTTSRSRNMSPSGTLSSTYSTSVRPAGSFYRTVYNSSTSDDDEDNMPLIQLKKTAFQDLMPM
ncbi:uncharacterized protein LOC134670975 [Cydia fagiglandana]|uniref:uncharacterized protein LOC134670975 n=1 Tax=Cydia fagiglandana TaxID=1458189 RepID=UPI002FEE30E7